MKVIGHDYVFVQKIGSSAIRLKRFQEQFRPSRRAEESATLPSQGSHEVGLPIIGCVFARGFHSIFPQGLKPCSFLHVLTRLKPCTFKTTLRTSPAPAPAPARPGPAPWLRGCRVPSRNPGSIPAHRSSTPRHTGRRTCSGSDRRSTRPLPCAWSQDCVRPSPQSVAPGTLARTSCTRCTATSLYPDCC